MQNSFMDHMSTCSTNMARIIGNLQGYERHQISSIEEIANSLSSSSQKNSLLNIVANWRRQHDFIEYCWSRRAEKLDFENLSQEWQSIKNTPSETNETR